MKNPLQGSFVLLFVAPFAVIQGRTTTKDPPDSNYNSFFHADRMHIAVRTTKAIPNQKDNIKNLV